jgi:hypothetical protein
MTLETIFFQELLVIWRQDGSRQDAGAPSGKQQTKLAKTLHVLGAIRQYTRLIPIITRTLAESPPFSEVWFISFRIQGSPFKVEDKHGETHVANRTAMSGIASKVLEYQGSDYPTPPGISSGFVSAAWVSPSRPLERLKRKHIYLSGTRRGTVAGPACCAPGFFNERAFSATLRITSDYSG